MPNFLNKAISNAINHTYHKDQDYHLCALIVRGGSILSKGFNKFGRSGLIDHYRTKDHPHHYNIHAEVDAILKERQKTDFTGAKIYIARICKKKNPDGTPMIGLAMPCPMCQMVLEAYGIRKVYFTIDNKTTGEMKL